MEAENPPPNNRWLPRLFGVWAWVTAAAFAVMLTHRSDAPVLLGRYSTLVAVMLGCLFILTMAYTAAWWALSHNAALLETADRRLRALRQRRWFPWVVMLGAGAALVGMWQFFLGNHLPTYGFLRAYIGFSIVVGALALLFGGSAPPPVGWKYLPTVLLAVFVVVALLTFSFYPALMKTDEAAVFSMARNALETGHPTSMIYRHVPFLPGGLWTWLMAGWLRLAGLGIASGRLYTLLVSFAALAFTWAAASRLYDRLTASFAMVIGAFAFISLNHMRYDAHTALLLAIALFFYSLGQTQGRWWQHFFTGLAAGLCIDSNPIAYCFGLGFALIYLARYLRQRRYIWMPFWWLALGGITALVIFYVTHQGSSLPGGESTNSMPVIYLNFVGQYLSRALFMKTSAEYAEAFLVHQPILCSLLICGIITAIVERTHADRALLVLYGVWTGVLIFAYYYFPIYYVVQALPILGIFAARGLTYGLPRLLNSQAAAPNAFTRAAFLFIGCWLLTSVGYDLLRLPGNSLEDVVETGRHIAEIVPSDAVIVASEAYYFGMPEHRGFVGGAIEGMMENSMGIPPAEVWPTIGPDAVVFSSQWSTEPGKTPVLLDYMEAEGFVLVRCWETVSYGQTELWMADVPAGISPDEACEPVCNPRLGCS